MNHLRHPHLAAWLALLIAAVGLLVLAQDRGERAERDGTAATVLGPVPAARSAAAPTVTQLRALAQSGVAAGVDPQALAGWAAQVAQLAAEGSAARAAEGATAADPLRAALSQVAARARHVRDVAGDPVSAAAGRTAVLLAIERSGAIVAGQPAPALPEPVADDPAGRRASAPHVPAAPVPDRPDAPTLQPAPSPAAPVHGAPPRPQMPTLPALPDPAS